MMSTTPASLYALVINALLFIGFYTKMRCPQIALTFSGIAPLRCSYYLLKPANDVLNVTWSANLYIDLFYTLRDYTIHMYNSEMSLGFKSGGASSTYCCGHNLPPKFHVGWTPPSPLSPPIMGFESPLNPSYCFSNGASDLPTYFCQQESPQTIIWKKFQGKKIIIHSEHS